MWRFIELRNFEEGDRMHHCLRDMIGRKILATDDVLGKVDDFYFDDSTWTARYVIVETGNWLSNRKVLISLAAFLVQSWNSDVFIVNLTCAQVRDSPDIDTKKPVYRQIEEKLHDYYQWSPYWGYGYSGTFGITLNSLLDNYPPDTVSMTAHDNEEHLRSICLVTGYSIHATDGIIGRIDNFLVDKNNWNIHLLVVETGDWMQNKKILVATSLISNINWADSSVNVNCSLESLSDNQLYVPKESEDPDDWTKIE
jgi:PRC-barrel domain